MASTFPYMISNNKIEPILQKIRKAAEPPKFTHSFLKKIGFKSTNDRAIIPLFKALGYLTDNGTPTEHYKDLRDDSSWSSSIGNQIMELYSDLYSVHTEIHNASDDEMKGAISRVTGKDASTTVRYFSTFKTLVKLADFNNPVESVAETKTEVKPETNQTKKTEIKIPTMTSNSPDFNYNIQIHLPATTDISVYNAIFKSIKENLM